MEIREFAGMVCNGMAEKLGPEYDVGIREIRKNNNIVRWSLVIRKKKANAVPVIYLESMWKAFESGEGLENIMDEILKVYKGCPPAGSLDVEKFEDFEKIKDGICWRLFGRKDNERLLKDMPYIEFLDMAVCFYYMGQAGEWENGLVPVNNALMESWGTDADGLFRLASENTPRIFPGECCPLEQLITKMMWVEFGRKEEDFPRIQLDGSPMQVLTNAKRLYGAACILYPGMLEDIARRWHGGFYIMPSSVHETILVQDTERLSPEKLKGMIYEVNREVLEPEEVLTDSLYYYDAAEKQVKIV